MSDGGLSRHHAEELRCLFTAHSAWLFGHGCFLSRNDAGLAEDLVQDTFVAAASSWAAVRLLSPDQQRAWLRKTLTYKAISAFRKAEVRRSHTATRAPERPLPLEPPEHAMTWITLRKAYKIIESLPRQQHMIAVMRWLEGMKEAEIAERLGITESTVGVQIFRIRKKLVAELGNDYPFGQAGRGL